MCECGDQPHVERTPAAVREMRAWLLGLRALRALAPEARAD
jgi:hypothetical protein